ncbi:MAG: O-antigen ligase family protein [Patescibacteria group bacterium]
MNTTSLRNAFNVQRSTFNVLWRIAILVLPWQTRWFMDANLAGWPWEQGRISIYLSWLPMIAAIIISQALPRKTLPRIYRRALFFLIAGLGLVTIANQTPDFRAIFAWWLQIVILFSFFITLLRSNVDFYKIAFWFVMSLVPHAMFAIIQVMIQYVPGGSWVGVATQNPAELGVSVAQTAEVRFLRAYGGFPHPNILGGYMVFAILIATWITNTLPLKLRGRESRLTRWRELCYLSTLPIFTAALFYSFSRSAWLALAFGFFIIILSSVLTSFPRKRGRDVPQSNKNEGQREGFRHLIPPAIILVTFSILALINWDLTAGRIGPASQSARLEQQSTSARTASLTDGLKLLQAYPLLGTGPNAELFALYQMNPNNDAGPATSDVRRILEPPHNTWLIMLVNFGVVGALIISGFLLFLLRQALSHWKPGDPSLRNLVMAITAAVFVISLFDYYFWAFWSGQTLLIFALFTILCWIVSRNPQATK